MATKLPSSIGLNIQTPDTIPGRCTRKQRVSEQRQTCHTCESSHDHRTGNASEHGGGRAKEGYVTGRMAFADPAVAVDTETNKGFPILAFPFLHKHWQTRSRLTSRVQFNSG